MVNAGTIVVDNYERFLSQTGKLRKNRIAITCDASGDVNNGAGAGIALSNVINGVLRAVEHIPGTGGNKPTDNYDIYITDEDGYAVYTNTAVDADAPSQDILTTPVYIPGKKLAIRGITMGISRTATLDLIFSPD